ncbi:3-phosphoshikimate 1-carboxyvinyltransferase [Desulfonispora thiosulfatigenes DSM 11270]|uniref:3-phosphoshikimate 1-carboxyvinyltransferase n=1 Tax=Desulfonispora thiosulfatigenes DSM 11270 TaxID=656914 RepID=A0A1W1V7Q6_DESTI|nr:3-phosphoshikimate 1-carboxyvinyltransferase [Desulfonispora thiosulfatigenes]SMB89210.1 3-phosphoshikimate 1-carboxyvinyltransferase [Desulfonispora thiosulfatigenes DSM 11270]
MEKEVSKIPKLTGKIKVPGDKSISHRAIMFGALAWGKTNVKGFLQGEDCLSTIKCFRKLGIKIEQNNDEVQIWGKGLKGLTEPQDILDVGNSGTTLRLISGILAGQNFLSILTGDNSIRKRPMARVTDPLRLMGADISGRENGKLAPLVIKGQNLKAINFTSPVASAQVKSAILLAGLYAEGITEVNEPSKSRNHTEIMLKSFGAEIDEVDNKVRIKPMPNLQAQDIHVPGDISSAAFFLVAGAIHPSADLLLEGVGLNPTRTGIIDVLQQMGANLEITETWTSAGEEVGNIRIKSSNLKGIKFGGDIIPRLIDEIPVIAVAACFASGITEIRDAEELKVKESNRLSTIATELTKLGAKIEELPDGLRIEGNSSLTGKLVESYHDHRIAMSLAVAGIMAEGTTVIKDSECVDISFPGFFEMLVGKLD